MSTDLLRDAASGSPWRITLVYPSAKFGSLSYTKGFFLIWLVYPKATIFIWLSLGESENINTQQACLSLGELLLQICMSVYRKFLPTDFQVSGEYIYF